MSGFLTWLKEYKTNDDPLLATTNVIALVLGGNQPFYPLYIWWIAGDRYWPSLFALLSTPFFLIVPAVARRSSLGARALLIIAGLANTILCTKLLGAPAGIELFQLPCVMLGAGLFGAREKLPMLLLAGLPIATFIWLNGQYGAPLVAYSDAEYAAMFRLNAVSAGTLTAFLSFLFARLREVPRPVV